MNNHLKDLQPYLRRLHHLHDLPDSVRDRITGKTGHSLEAEVPVKKDTDKP